VPEMSAAAVLLDAGKVEIQEFALPEIGDDDGLLRVEATGVCGSDIAAYRGHAPFYELPCVLGHELVGRVERLGEAAARRWRIAEGDRIVVEEYLPCGTCRGCLAGAYQMCEVKRYGGKSIHVAPSLFGGFSDYMYLHPQAIVHRAPEAVSAELLQLYIPIANGLHWVQDVGEARVGSTVVVIGPGPHGLGCVVGAREAGAGTVILVGLPSDRVRLEVGQALGADHVLTGSVAENTAAIAELTEGLKADAVINAAGGAVALEMAVAAAGPRGVVVQTGLAEGPGGSVAAIAAAVVERRLTIKGVLGRPSTAVPPALRLIASGRYPLERMCTGTYSVAETEAALRETPTDPEAIRSIVVPAR
jgi:threonine dehydrogenase-like Zn-dependent dehydrogenase